MSTFDQVSIGHWVYVAVVGFESQDASCSDTEGGMIQPASREGERLGV